MSNPGVEERRYHIRIASDGRELVAIDDFRIPDSSITILFGESGIGKSLSALAIAGLLDPDQLDVRINRMRYEEYLRGPDIADIRRNGFVVFQEPSSHLNPLMTLRAQLREGTLAAAPGEERALTRLWLGEASSKIETILDVYPKPYRPSGGEKQRILAAMAFKKMAGLGAEDSGALFIFDEPTGNLDNALRNEFLDLLVEHFRRCPATVLLITHDYSMISRFATRYQDIAKKVHYRELSLEKGRHVLEEFKPSDYLDWIHAQKAQEKKNESDEIVLRLDPRVRVFGRTLVVTSDAEGKMPAPLVVRKGSMVYLKAPSGVGKTTIVKLLMGLLDADSMKMQLKGQTYTEATARKEWARHVWGRQMAMVFQHADEALNQLARVRDVFAGLPQKKDLDNAAIARILSGLFDDGVDQRFLYQPVRYLSGGQKQRLNLLRSMVLDTDVLFLDEPLNGLDFSSSLRVLSALGERLRRLQSVVVISHNEEIFDAMVASGNVYYLHAQA